MSEQHLPQSKDAERPITPNQRKLVDQIMSTGKSVAECATALGRDVSNCYRDLRKPNVKRYLQERTLEHIGILAPIAARTQGELLTAQSDHVRASVAENILDRQLGKPVQRSQVQQHTKVSVSIDLS